MIREKRTKSGKLLEVDFYPVWNDGRRMPSRSPKANKSTAEQAKYNKKQATKKLIRLINANFDSSDIIMHPTYTPSKAPLTEEQARRDVTSYLRRVKYRREKEVKIVEQQITALSDDKSLDNIREGLKLRLKKLKAPFKYIYVTEKVTYKSGKLKGKDNWHFHLFVTGGLSRRTLESMWGDGMRANADVYQPDRFGPDAIAKYMSKDPAGAKRFCCSRNLDKPQTKSTKDGHITAQGVERIAKLRPDDKDYWERRHKGYKFLKCYARYNEYNGYWYVTAVMYKTSSTPPRWEMDDWLDVN